MAKDHGVMTGTSGGGLNLDDLKEEEILRKKEWKHNTYTKSSKLLPKPSK